MSLTHLRRGTLVVTLAAATVASGSLTAIASAKPAQPQKTDFTLTLLHANDLESSLLPVAGNDTDDADTARDIYGGVDRFVELVQREQQAATATGGVITISAGDNFLPGPQLAASEDPDAPIYDATAFNEAGFDVSILGNHDFDQNPDFLARYLGDIDDTTFVSGNLGFADEPALLAEVKDGTIVTSHVVETAGQQVGIIGLTTPELPRLTSSRGVTVDPALAGIANAQAKAFRKQGVDKVVLVSHLQDIDNEVALARQLKDVDIIVGGGGHELLADAGDPLVPNGAPPAVYPTPYASYPILATDAQDKAVPVVTTAALYSYVGRLVVTFDDKGRLVDVDDEQSRPLPVLAQGPDAVAPDAAVNEQVVRPVEAYVSSLGQTVVASSEVPLNGIRNDVRSRETNLGDLVADSLLAVARREAAAQGIAGPVVALQNGGGIRNSSTLPAGNLTALHTYTVLPFSNFVALAPQVPVATFIAAVERGLSYDVVDDVLQPDGRFAQAAGYTVQYDASRPSGARVVNLMLADGTVLVSDGVPTGSLSTIAVATNDFTFRGGDGYDFTGVDFTVLPVTYQQALMSYLTDDLGGTVTSAAYPVGGSGRIIEVD